MYLYDNLRKYGANNPRQLDNWTRKYIFPIFLCMTSSEEDYRGLLIIMGRYYVPIVRLSDCVPIILKNALSEWMRMLDIFVHVVNLFSTPPRPWWYQRCPSMRCCFYTLSQSKKPSPIYAYAFAMHEKNDYRPDIMITRSYAPSSQSI